MSGSAVAGSQSLNEAIYKLSAHVASYKSTAEGAVTLSVDEFMNGVYVQTGTPGAVNKTTPTAAAMVAAYPEAKVGTQFEFILDNGGDGVLTLVAGTGVTLSGTATCAIGKNKRFVGVFTSVTSGAEAVRVICAAQLA